MTSLNFLDVSYNKLFGRISSGTQLQSFETSTYTGNAEPCGLPISKNCPGDEFHILFTEKSAFELERWFYIGGGIGFATGFWIACGALLLNHHGRRTFFLFVDFVKDWVCVKVAMFIRKLERVALYISFFFMTSCLLRMLLDFYLKTSCASKVGLYRTQNPSTAAGKFKCEPLFGCEREDNRECDMWRMTRRHLM
ncbi:hypothetical protein OSB04_un000763 [Centaurea solstitialis]|uniref:Uncharacterized protein n=1 Tax=Centaurea solstitialis TaxID=347529 RepID=A0AA38SPX0_9ASTR|nr:hypothetical protein OSB04_un000763 [Centaurea solstitialis]